MDRDSTSHPDRSLHLWPCYVNTIFNDSPANMKTLILMRHAKSDWSTGEHDKARPLNRRGRNASPRMADWLLEQGDWPEVLLCSTSMRTRETWDLMSERMSRPSNPTSVEFVDDLYLAPAPSIWQIVCQSWASKPQVDRLMVLGHNPGLESLISQLSDQPVELPTAAIAIFQFESLPQPLEQPTVTSFRFRIPRQDQ
jgi:phosphohistidine phosphatase